MIVTFLPLLLLKHCIFHINGNKEKCLLNQSPCNVKSKTDHYPSPHHLKSKSAKRNTSGKTMKLKN